MATFRDNFALGVDFSSYQPRVEWDTLKAGGVDFAFARSSLYSGGWKQDAMFATHVQGAYDADIPMLAYHVLAPGYYAYQLGDLGKLQDLEKWLPVEKDEQFMCLVNSIRNKKIYGVAIDYEIYMGWDNKSMPDGWLFEVWRQFVWRCQKYFPILLGKDYPIITYTANWFVSVYCPSMINVGCKQTIDGVTSDASKLWVAHYPYDGNIVVLDNWNKLPAYYPPNDMTIAGRVTQNPPFIGFDGWTFWQFSGDKFKLPGVYSAAGSDALSATDLNFYNGTKEKLYSWLKFTPKTDPVHDPDPVDPTPDPTPTDGKLTAALKAAAQAFLAALE